jgi:hypothetical protein
MLFAMSVPGREEASMKILRQMDFVYTLYEDDNGALIMDVLVPSTKNAWANYEKRIVLNMYDGNLVRMFPHKADIVAKDFIAKEKSIQQDDS